MGGDAGSSAALLEEREFKGSFAPDIRGFSSQNWRRGQAQPCKGGIASWD